jgi:hypothetical protein
VERNKKATIKESIYRIKIENEYAMSALKEDKQKTLASWIYRWGLHASFISDCSYITFPCSAVKGI